MFRLVFADKMQVASKMSVCLPDFKLGVCVYVYINNADVGRES